MENKSKTEVKDNKIIVDEELTKAVLTIKGKLKKGKAKVGLFKEETEVLMMPVELTNNTEYTSINPGVWGLELVDENKKTITGAIPFSMIEAEDNMTDYIDTNTTKKGHMYFDLRKYPNSFEDFSLLEDSEVDKIKYLKLKIEYDIEKTNDFYIEIEK